MPTELSRQWFARGYYGAVAHNVERRLRRTTSARTTATRPTSTRCRREAAGRRYVEYMGGADADPAPCPRRTTTPGDFRWVVEVLEPRRVRGARRIGRRASSPPTRWSSSATRPNRPPGATRTCWRARELRSTSAASRRAACRSAPTWSPCCRSAASSSTSASASTARRRRQFSARFDWRLIDGKQVDAQRLTLSNGALNHLPGSHGDGRRGRRDDPRGAVETVAPAARRCSRRFDGGEIRVTGDHGAVPRFVEIARRVRPDVQRRRALIGPVSRVGNPKRQVSDRMRASRGLTHSHQLTWRPTLRSTDKGPWRPRTRSESLSATAGY